jgi:hypothetical protein
MNPFQTLKAYYRYLQDKQNVSQYYELRFNKKMNWRHPTGFNEKMQIFKISKEAEALWPYADKYEVRKYIEEKIGSTYLTKLYGVYNDAEEIKIDELPNSFVLKATHGSGWNVLCPDKKKFNWNDQKPKFIAWMRLNYYVSFGREKQYNLIKPRIVCEEFLEAENGDLRDYRFFCFRGQPRFIQHDINTLTDHRRNFYDCNWNQYPKLHTSKPNTDKPIEKPAELEQMIEIAKKLAAPFKHVRVDLYNVKGKIYFGELTFTSGSGAARFDPWEYDRIFGEMFV